MVAGIMYLPPITNLVATVNANGLYQIDIPAANVKRLLKRIPLQGPPGSSVSIFIETVFLDITFRGDANSAEYFDGVPIAAGQMVHLIWNVGTGTPVPTASAFLELEPITNTEMEYNAQGY